MSNWTPYKIPPTPNVGDGKTYRLAVGDGADSAKNPSNFLDWKEDPDIEALIARLDAVEARLDATEARLDATEARLDAATIDAECQGGNVVVTLNL